MILDTDFYLFLYDIHKPRTLRKIVKLLETVNSSRIQKSLFEIQSDFKEISSFITQAELLIDLKTDKIALIPLCKSDYDRVECFGVMSRRPRIQESYQIL